MGKGTPMVRPQFENITNLGLLLSTVFNDQLTAVVDETSVLNTLYNVQNSTQAVERTQGVGGFGDPVEYDGTIEYDSFELLYRKEYEHVDYTLGMAVEARLLRHEQYGVFNERAQRLGLAFDRKIYKDAISVFNNAFATTYTDEKGRTKSSAGADSVALCSASHPYSPSNSDTQSNRGTSALSVSALQDAEVAMMQFKDSRTNPMAVMPDLVLVPPALKHTALEITGSSLRSDTANNATNTVDGYRVIVSPYLTDANNWFLIDSRLANQYLRWYFDVRPTFAEHPDSDYDLVLRYRGHMAYSFGFDHWCWVYGSEVSDS